MTFSGKEGIIHNVSGAMLEAMDVRLAQLDRAFGYGPKGRGFESSNAREIEMARMPNYGHSRYFFRSK